MGLDTLEKGKIFPLQASNGTTVLWSTSPQPSQYTVLSQASNSCRQLFTQVNTLNSEWHSVYSISYWCYRVFVSQHVLFWKYRGYIFFTHFKLLYFTKKKKKKYIYTLTQTFSTIYIYIIIVDGCNMTVINFQHSHKNLQTRLVKISQ